MILVKRVFSTKDYTSCGEDLDLHVGRWRIALVFILPIVPLAAVLKVCLLALLVIQVVYSFQLCLVIVVCMICGDHLFDNCVRML